MIIAMERNNEETDVVGAVNLEGVTTTYGLFTAVQDCVVELMETDEVVVRVDVKRLSASPTTEDLMVGFIMAPKASQSGTSQSWEVWLKKLRNRAVETRVSVKMELEAIILIGRAV